MCGELRQKKPAPFQKNRNARKAKVADGGGSSPKSADGAAEGGGGAWGGLKNPLSGLGGDMDGVFIKIKETAGFKEEEPQGFMDEVGDQLSLSWKQRLSCFAGFMAMSIVCYLLSFPWIVLAPKKFAFFFTCANLFGIASTAFLMGPARQLRSMKEHNRLMISTIYVTSMFMTLVAAVQWRELVMVVLFSCVQVCPRAGVVCHPCTRAHYFSLSLSHRLRLWCGTPSRTSPTPGSLPPISSGLS